MFIDEIIISLEAGRGGDGCTSFRHEKFIEMGGPDGGDGGRGGDIIFVSSEGLNTLIDLRYNKKIKGEKGSNGSGANKTGESGKNVYVKVPVGTTLIDMDTNLVICDLTKDKQECVVCTGGKGGRGNARFKSNKMKAPTISEYGSEGEKRTVKCELKLLADVGLIGLPSVGKSSLINSISAAKAKVADYHFTTLTPNLGMVNIDNYSYCVADLPGIIEGASKGVGLGDKFLKHALRCKVIAYVIDFASTEGDDPIEVYKTLLNETKSYSEKLSKKKSIIIGTKMDMPGYFENKEKFLKEFNVDVIDTSAITKEGLDNLKYKLKDLIINANNEEVYEDNELESYMLYEFKNELPYTIKKQDDHTYILSGNTLEELLKKTRFNSDEAALRFAKKLKNLGVDDELHKLGAQDGDTIKILDQEFEYNERLNY